MISVEAAPVVSVSYSHRQVAHLHVDPDIPEGCIIATFSSELPASVILPPEGVETLDNSHWKFIFTWDHITDLTLHFTDASTETTTVVAFPEPVSPLDPLQHEIPVLDIRTAPANLWDPATGLYVFGENDNCLQHGSEWERASQFVFFDGSLSPEFTEPMGLRINGGWSRRFNQKGLRFYFDDYGTSDEKEYDFFGSEPSSFRRLILRCGVSPRRCFTDALAADTFSDMGHITSRWAPLAVYLNGEYWGFYPLRERIDEEFIEHTHGLTSGDYALMKDGETLHGDSSDFWGFFNECSEPGEFSSHDFFLHAEETINLISYIDWLLINIYGATTDNGSAYNSAQFKPGDEPWQFMVWDEDGLFYSENYWDNFFYFLSINSQEEYEHYLPVAIFTGSAYARIRWAAPFRALLQNSEFKQLFSQRYLELMDTWFSQESLSNRLDGIISKQEPEMIRHGERWNWPTQTWYQIEANHLYSWFQTRPGLLNEQFEEFMEHHRGPVELVQFHSELLNDHAVQLNWHTTSEENCSGYILYRGDHPDNLTAQTSWTEESALEGQGGIWNPAQYTWTDDTTSPNQDYYYQLAWVNRHGLSTLLPWINEISTVEPGHLFINEFLANNVTGIIDETGTHEDWVEIYNQGPGAVNLDGYFLTDDPAVPTRWSFPETILESGQYLLVWCDSDPEDGPLHTNFKLNASGESIALMGPLDQDNETIDEHVFGFQTADVSEGRQTDGSETWVNFRDPTPGNPNQILSAIRPWEEAIPGMPELLSVSPNPFNPATVIRFHIDLGGPVTVRIFSLKGTLVRDLIKGQGMSAGQHSMIWNGRNNRGQAVASGRYFLRISNGRGEDTAKLLLVK